MKISHEQYLARMARRAALTEVEARDLDQQLLNASSLGYAQEALARLFYGADPDACDDNGDTPLILASHSGHTATIYNLLEGRADPVKTNKKGISPLEICIDRGFIACCQAFEKYLPRSLPENFIAAATEAALRTSLRGNRLTAHWAYSNLVNLKR